MVGHWPCVIHGALFPVPRQFSHLQDPLPWQTGQGRHPSLSSQKSKSPTVITPVPWHHRHSLSPWPWQQSQSSGLLRCKRRFTDWEKIGRSPIRCRFMKWRGGLKHTSDTDHTKLRWAIAFALFSGWVHCSNSISKHLSFSSPSSLSMDLFSALEHINCLFLCLWLETRGVRGKLFFEIFEWFTTPNLWTIILFLWNVTVEYENGLCLIWFVEMMFMSLSVKQAPRRFLRRNFRWFQTEYYMLGHKTMRQSTCAMNRFSE